MMSLLLASVSASALSVGGGPGGSGIVIEGITSDTQIQFGDQGLVLSVPAGDIGDLLLLVLTSDEGSGVNVFTPPAGFELFQFAGGTTPDVGLGLYAREADGTEGATVTATSSTALASLAGWCLRLSGAGYIESVGQLLRVASAASGNVPSVQALTDSSLSLAFVAADGVDTAPFTVPPSDGYTMEGTLTSGTGANGVAAAIASKTLNQGESGDPLFTLAVADGIAAFNVVVQPAGVDQTLLPEFHPGFTPGVYTTVGNKVTNTGIADNDFLWAAGALPLKGKCYFESSYKFGGATFGHRVIGITEGSNRETALNSVSGRMTSFEVVLTSTLYQISSSPGGTGSVATFGAPSESHIIMIAYDADTGDIWFGVNGVWSQGDPAAGTSPNRTVPLTNPYFGGSPRFLNSSVTVYAKAADLTYSPPTGFSPVAT